MNNELPKIECIETLAYNVKYTASDAACHEMLCDAVMRRIVPSEIALDIAEQYAVRSFTEQTASDLQEELDRLDAIEREDIAENMEGSFTLQQNINPGSDLPQAETPEEKELLDTVERLILSPGGCVYYNGTDYSFRKRSWQDVCLACHYDDDMSWMVHERSSPAYRVGDLEEWDRQNALDAIRSLHERLATV